MIQQPLKRKIFELEVELAKLQKQSDLLTLGLLQEKNKVTVSLHACKFAKAQIKKGAHKKALPILRAAIAKLEQAI